MKRLNRSNLSIFCVVERVTKNGDTKTNDSLLVPLSGGSMRFDILSYRKIHRWIAVAVCVAIFSFTAEANAQIAGTGSIQGSDADSTSAIFHSAPVTVTTVPNQVKQAATTDANSTLSVPSLA